MLFFHFSTLRDIKLYQAIVPTMDVGLVTCIDVMCIKIIAQKKKKKRDTEDQSILLIKILIRGTFASQGD